MIPKEEFKILGKQENFLNRVTQALTRPIQSRCAELAVLFDRGSMKDLHTVFPLLIDSIFGPHGTVCWELRSITSTVNPQDFQALQYFLSPLGPMFRLIYTLLRDPQVKFEFSIACVPSKVRYSLNGSTMHPFYADLVHVDPQTNQVVSLMLNPFDYYFFHFGYHLINPFHQRSYLLGSSAWSTVYYILCCDYVIHFLPTNPSNPVLPVLNFYSGKNPIYMLPSFSRPSKTSRLFRVDPQSINKAQTLEHHPRNEIWRSETIMTVFIDIWLNNDQVLSSDQNFNRTFDDSNMSYQMPQQKFHMHELPTGEYIRIIRVLVKQLHSFAASAKADDSHMGELKKIVTPYLQGRMYILLRHLIHRWPVDGSFRLVLELWVSFIQPWRYMGNEYAKNSHELNPDLDDINTTAPMHAVDKAYMQFMAENLLAYTVLLQQLLPRFSRVDLSSPKIALILYRLTKVFAQPDLVPLLHEIEKCVENFSSSPLHSYAANTSSNLPPLSPTSKWSMNCLLNLSSLYGADREKEYKVQQSNANGSLIYDSGYGKSFGKWENVVKQKILEFEGSNFVYKPIFATSPADEVYELLCHIKKSEEIARCIIQTRIDEMRHQSKGIFGFLKSLFMITESNGDEFTMEERKKVPTYLQLSSANLKQIFQISENKEIGQQSSVDDTSTNLTSFQNDLKYLLTPKQVRERVKTFKYEGDPDLLPVRSDEVKFLVRLLYQLALKINEDFRPQIDALYNKDNFWGKLSRQLISPPLMIYKYEKSFPGRSPRVPQQLPPRISLRYFASQKFLFYFIMGIILSKLLGYGYLTFIFIAFLFWFFYICLKAACDVRPSHPVSSNDNSVDIHNFSFNESL